MHTYKVMRNYMRRFIKVNTGPILKYNIELILFDENINWTPHSFLLSSFIIFPGIKTLFFCLFSFPFLSPETDVIPCFSHYWKSDFFLCPPSLYTGSRSSDDPHLVTEPRTPLSDNRIPQFLPYFIFFHQLQASEFENDMIC